MTRPPPIEKPLPPPNVAQTPTLATRTSTNPFLAPFRSFARAPSLMGVGPRKAGRRSLIGGA